jgi:hypothetical protein
MEDKIKLEFTRKQIDQLMTLTYLGKWMLDSMEVREIGFVDPYEELEQLIYSKADPKDIHFIEENGYQPSTDFEDRMHEYTQIYDESVFWMDLTDKLADRDLILKYGTSLNTMTDEEILDQTDELIDFYQEEFEKNGLLNLRVEPYNASLMETNSN